MSSVILHKRTDKYDKPIKGIIHIGAHICEEWKYYENINASKVLWIDGNEKAMIIGVDVLKNNNVNNQTYILTYLSNKNDTETFYTTTNNCIENASGRDDSLMKPLEIDLKIKSVINANVKRLDTLFIEQSINIADYNTLVIDVQGAELKVLAGCGNILNYMDFVVCEAWRDERYIDGTPIDKLRFFMQKVYGFKETYHTAGKIWQDVLFEK